MCLTDRATWISFKNKRDFQDSWSKATTDLFNQYGVILVNPKRCPSVNQAAGQKFIDWLVSRDGQKAIGDYKLGGKQLFFPNAGKGQS